MKHGWSRKVRESGYIQDTCRICGAERFGLNRHGQMGFAYVMRDGSPAPLCLQKQRLPLAGMQKNSNIRLNERAMGA